MYLQGFATEWHAWGKKLESTWLHKNLSRYQSLLKIKLRFLLLCNFIRNYIKDNLNFDQIIWEFGNDTNPDWVHISYISEDQNRNRCLKAERKNGKAVYSII